MAARLVGIPAWQFLDDQAAVLAGGTLDFHEPGTSTDKSIWTDAAKNTEHSNPITLDAAGRPPNPVFVEGLYDITVKDSDGNTITTISNWGTNFSTNSEQSPNLVCNYSFEDDEDADNVPDEWTFTGSNGARITTDQTHGTASVKFTGASSSSDSIDSCFIPVSPNCTYEISFEYKTSNSSATPKLIVKQYDDTQSSTSNKTIWEPSSTSTSWKRVSRLIYTPSAGSFWAKLSFDANTDATSYNTFLDNVWIKLIPGIPQAGFRPTGLEISRDTDTDHDINVTAGSVIADDGSYPIVLETEITKQIDAGWSAGDDSGGLAIGSSIPADGILYVFLIADSDAGLVDILIDESATSPAMPSGWDKKQYIGSWRTNSSNNLEPGKNIGSYWWWDNEIEDVNDTSIASGATATATLTAPPKSVVFIRQEVDMDASTTPSDDLEISVYPVDANYDQTMRVKHDPGFASKLFERIANQSEVRIDNSSQCKYSVTYNGTFQWVKIYTRGWIDLKREYSS